MGLSVFYVRISFGGWFSFTRSIVYKVGASHYATAAQRAIREALKSRKHCHSKIIKLYISRNFTAIENPGYSSIYKEFDGTSKLVIIGKFSAGRKVPHVGKKSIWKQP